MNFKRIVAIIGIIILAALYIATFISALFTSPAAPQMFKACIYASVAIPVMFYAYLLIYKLIKDKSELNKAQLDETIKKQSKEAEKAEASSKENQVKK